MVSKNYICRLGNVTLLFFASFLLAGAALAQEMIGGHIISRPVYCNPENNSSIGEPETFTVTFKTGDRHKAGTDGKIALYIATECGMFEAKFDAGDKNGQVFERNTTDRFRLSVAHNGFPSAIMIVLEEDGRRPGWFSQYVQIKSTLFGGRNCFKTSKWLASTVAGGQTTGFVEPYPQVDEECPLP